MILSGLHNNEMLRIMHCQGCKFLGKASTFGYCKYYLETDMRRPNKGGIKDCKVRVLEDSQKKVDEVVKKTLKRQKDIAAMKESQMAKWDTQKAKELYFKGFTYKEIALAVGVTKDAVSSYASLHGWTGKRGNKDNGQV